MFLFDPRLKFARDLIGHWLDIRCGAAVPLEADLDPRALLRCYDRITIVELVQHSKLNIELAGAAFRRRFGRDLIHMNWVELVPPVLGNAGERARERIRSTPCGFFHKFNAACGDGAPVTVETLTLPLRRRNATLPHAAIGVTRDFGTEAAGAPAGWLTPSTRIAHYFMEFVDLQ
jgi:hypothetical protein